jgi:hypothetical protein
VVGRNRRLSVLTTVAFDIDSCPLSVSSCPGAAHNDRVNRVEETRCWNAPSDVDLGVNGCRDRRSRELGHGAIRRLDLGSSAPPQCVRAVGGFKMSSLAYGALTRKREEATPGTSGTDSPPGLKTYVDALAALVPAEVLTVHAAIMAKATKTVTSATGDTGTTITNPETLKWAFVALFLISIGLYVLGHVGLAGRNGWDRWDWIRMLIPGFAFVGWTMIQKVTMFDAVRPDWDDVPRFTVAVIGAVVLAAIAAGLSYTADQKRSG